jgi:cyanophycinase
MQGHLILHGGGSTGADTTRKFIRHAGGVEAPLIVLPQSSAEAGARGQRSADWLKENGARNVYASPVTRPDDPAMGDLLQRLKTAAGVWVPGGDQNRLMSVFAGTPVPQAVRAVLARGGAAGGSSAGASLAGEWMPTGDGDRTKLVRGSVATAAGLNLWPGVLVDSHFLTRERTQRLLDMILTRPELIGIGIEENAWIEADLSRQTMTAMTGQVVLLRAAGEVRADAAGRLSCPDVRLRVLLPGETADLNRFRKGG